MVVAHYLLNVMSKCKHEYYKQGHHLVSSEALKAMKVNKICWMGIIVTECKDCGADLREHKVVPVLTVDEWLEALNK